MRVALLAASGVADSGLALLYDVFSAANLLASRAGDASTQFSVTVYGQRRTVRTGYGLTVPATPWSQVAADEPDLVVVPGLGLPTDEVVVDAVTGSSLAKVIGQLHASGTEVAGACSGTFFLAEAGILDGRDATTSWWLGPLFRRRYPSVALDESRALVFADSVTTAGAALAHIDLGLSLVRRISPELCDAVAGWLAVGDRPTQAAVSSPGSLIGGDRQLAAFDRYVRDHLSTAFSVRDAANAIGLSERTLQRLTASELGMTPLRFVQRTRTQRAVQLLRTTDQSLATIATAVGYRDASTLRALIMRDQSVSIKDIRRRRRITEH